MAKIETIKEARVLYSLLNHPQISNQERATILEMRVSEVEAIINTLISTNAHKNPPRFIKKTN